MVTFNGVTWVQVLTFLVAVALPVLVALVTQRMASSGLKAAVLAALAAATGFLSELLDALVNQTPYDVGAALLIWLGSFVIAVAVHFGLWKPGGVTGSQGVVARAVPGGLGEEQPGKHSVAAVLARIEAEGR